MTKEDEIIELLKEILANLRLLNGYRSTTHGGN